MAKKNSSYENLQTGVRRRRLPEIEAWVNMYPEKDYWIEMEIPEFTCICPKTGLPDFACVSLKYRPDKLCLELKSFKLYMNAYRSFGIFHEHAVNRILEDIVAACNPRQAIVSGRFNPRGGIITTVSSEFKSDENDKTGTNRR